MTHYRGIPTAEERTSKLEDATQVCIDGLLDDDTHLIYRPGLSRRLTRLEVKLNLPPEERHISHAALLTCETRELVGMRAALNAGIRRAEEEGLQMDDDNDDAQPTQAQAQPQQVGKSVWVGRDGEVTVEGWVLEWWKAKGYEGYHAESSILTTLFALLMWPVLFHPLPGAFETAYQTAPLDLGDDGFARARADILGSHLARLEDTTTALQILHETDERERPRSTWAVGLSWDFEPTHLSQILECLGGPAAAAICRMLAEEYRHRASGVPDLM
jgi:Fanconi-associated nuclease 1